MNEKTLKTPTMSTDELAMLGGNQIAYVRELEAHDAVEFFPAAGTLPPNMRVFMLHAADGTPIMLGDSRDSVIHNAWENSLQPVSVH